MWKQFDPKKKSFVGAKIKFVYFKLLFGFTITTFAKKKAKKIYNGHPLLKSQKRFDWHKKSNLGLSNKIKTFSERVIYFATISR